MRRTRDLLILLAASFVSGCNSEKVTGLPTVASVFITTQFTSLIVGSGAQLEAFAVTQSGELLTDRTISWSTSDSTVATVSSLGVVTAISPGTARIIATSEGKVAFLDLTVRLPRIASIVISPTNPTVVIGDSIQLKATLLDSLGRELVPRPVTWLMTTPNGNSVSSTGLVRTNTATLSRVTATADSVTGATFVRVLQSPAVQLELFPSYQLLFPLDNPDVEVAGTIYWTARDSTGKATSNANVTFTSSDSRVVLSDGFGQVTVSGRSVVPSVTITGKVGLASATAKVRVIGASTIVAGESHMCFLSDLGEPYCWGRNVNGELGIGESDSVTRIPRKTTGNLTLSILSLGDAHSCGLTPDGQAYCWGANENGQLGDGTNRSSLTPIASAGSLRFQSIGAGWSETCALSLSGDIYCWGRDAVLSNSNVPRLVQSSVRLSSVVVASRLQCGLDADGAAFCWGRNEYGQSGIGTASAAALLQPTAVTGGLRFKQLTANDAKVCGLTLGGDTYCWGKLGQTEAVTPAPVGVAGGLKFTTISMNRTLLCGIMADLKTMCAGELPGNSTRDSGSNFVQVAPLYTFLPSTFKMVAVGFTTRCVVTVNGTPLCWGLGGGSPYEGTGVFPDLMRRPPVE